MDHHEHSGQLLNHVLLRLSPEVFFHPVWTHFIQANNASSAEVLQSLLHAAEELQRQGDVGTACQLWLACAAQQSRQNDDETALASIQHALTLAEHHALPFITEWAIWGASAVCVHQIDFHRAAEYLERLRVDLHRRNEWILADVIDVIRQALLSQAQAEVTAAALPLSSDVALSSAFEQLLHWDSPSTVKRISDASLNHGDWYNGQAAAPSKPNRKSLLQTIKRVVKGELRLKWVEAGVSAPLRGAEERHAITPAPDKLTALASAPTPPHPDQPPTLDQQPEPDRPFVPAQDQELAAVQSLATDRPDTVAESAAPPSITAHLLGTFSVAVNDATVQSWPTGKGRAVFKYLLAHHDQPISRDVLMDAFWPQAGPEAARNSLNVALHGLRQALKTVTDKPVILFEEGEYGINPEFNVWVDVDEFERHVQAGRHLDAKGQLARAAAEYEAATELYQGDFLSGDPYEEWPVLPRERYRVAYLDILDRLSQIYFNQGQYADCITLCQLALTRDACREDIHCLLMRCYSRQGQRHLALRQYQLCVEALRVELEVDTAPETTKLFEQIRRRERV